MVFELSFVGFIVGTLSGFFGIGGGTILVPMLLFLGYEMKSAVGISVIQMVFSSIYGSILNFSKGTLDIKMVSLIGAGGFSGALLSSLIIKSVDAKVLELTFIGFVLFALSRLYLKPKEFKDEKSTNRVVLFVIGLFIGMFSISIGVGGSILLVPILVGFLHVPLKKAISAGLFFVVFSSVSGFISLSTNGILDYHSGLIIGIASLFGVQAGIHLKHKSSDELQKTLLLFFYIVVLIYLSYRMFFQ